MYDKDSLVHRNNRVDVDFKNTLKPAQKAQKSQLYRIIIITSLFWILLYGLIIFHIIYGGSTSENKKEYEIHDLYSFNKIFMEKLKNNRTVLFGKKDSDDEVQLFLNLTQIAKNIIEAQRPIPTTTRRVRVILNRNDFLHQQLEKLREERREKLQRKLNLLRQHLNKKYMDMFKHRDQFKRNIESSHHHEHKKPLTTTGTTTMGNFFIEASLNSSTNPPK